MTRKRFDNRDTPFGNWIRNNSKLMSSLGFDFQDLDHIYPNDFDDKNSKHKVYINHQFLHGRLMFIEEKQFKAQRTMSQRDTFGILDQWCKYADGIDVKRVIDDRPTTVIYWGWFVIQLERQSPEDGKVWINGKSASIYELEQLLLFSPKMRNKFRMSDAAEIVRDENEQD